MAYEKKKKIDKICLGCGLGFSTGKTFQVFCNPQCHSAFISGKRDTANARLFLPTGTVGAIAELMVSADLMRQGFEVFRAMSPSSNCDVLATRGEEVRKYEIRTGQYYVTRDNQKKLGYPKARTEGKIVAVVTHSDQKIHYIDH